MGLLKFNWRTAFDHVCHVYLRAAIRAEPDGPGEHTRAGLMSADGDEREPGRLGRVHGL